MSNIAIIGAGYAGLLTAHALQRAGKHQVTLFADRSPEAYLEQGRPPGTPVRFHPALEFEREIGLDIWSREAPPILASTLTVAPAPDNRLLTMIGRLPRPASSIDPRLQSALGLNALQATGARVEITSVNAARLDALSAGFDLTIVATGRADLAELFERDETKSKHVSPARHLAMVQARPRVPNVSPGDAVSFNVVGEQGEIFFFPHQHKSGQPVTSVVLEAVPGSSLDCFSGLNDGSVVFDRLRELVERVLPWQSYRLKEHELADTDGWLVGAFTPVVRRPVAKLPSGRVVTGVGDALVTLDPIAAQGANNGARMARHLSAAITRHDGSFDEAWMTRTFEAFYAEHGRHAFTFSDILGRPMSAAGQALMIAQYGTTGQGASPEQQIANLVASNFADPSIATPCFEDVTAAHACIRNYVRGPLWVHLLRKKLAIGAQQLRRMLRLDQRHPAWVPQQGVAANEA